MFKPLLIAAALSTFGAASAYAQTTQPAPADRAPAVEIKNQAVTPTLSADTRKLIGRNVKNPQGETVGEIEAIYVGQDGRINSVVIGVGGFLGVGQREVQVSWKDLQVADGGEKVTINMTKDQLKAKAPYSYRDPSYRGRIFSDRGIWTDNQADTRADRRMTDTRPADTRPANVATKDFNADGHMSNESILGASVRNTNDDKVGEVEDAYVDNKGQIQTVVVSVGGFLGLGERHVAVKWSDLQFKRDGNKLVLITNWTKDSLKAMPEYKYDRREQAQNR